MHPLTTAQLNCWWPTTFCTTYCPHQSTTCRQSSPALCSAYLWHSFIVPVLPLALIVWDSHSSSARSWGYDSNQDLLLLSNVVGDITLMTTSLRNKHSSTNCHCNWDMTPHSATIQIATLNVWVYSQSVAASLDQVILIMTLRCLMCDYNIEMRHSHLIAICNISCCLYISKANREASRKFCKSLL